MRKQRRPCKCRRKCFPEHSSDPGRRPTHTRRLYSHEARPALQVHGQVGDGEVKLVQGRLHVADGQPQPAQAAAQVALPTEEAPGEGQQDVSARLWAGRASDPAPPPDSDRSGAAQANAPGRRRPAPVQRPGTPSAPLRFGAGRRGSGEPPGGGEPLGGLAGPALPTQPAARGAHSPAEKTGDTASPSLRCGRAAPPPRRAPP